jgi:hypothetical protein
MSIYVPNSGEKEALKAILQQQALIVGLFKAAIVPDGSTIFATLSEMTAGGAGYGYAPVALTNDVLESATPTAAKWTIITNSAGKAEAVYGATAIEWTFLAPDVALLETCYGVYYATLVLPFTAGVYPIKPGDVLRQAAVCAEVTGVNVTSGSFALGTAAGNIYLKRQSGVFLAGATLVGVSNPTLATQIKVLATAPVAGGTGYAVGDLFSISTGTGGVGRVTAVTGGVVTAVELLAGGSGYAVATAATVAISGAGANDLTVGITSLYATQAPTLACATIAGDSNKVLVAVESLTTAIPITVLGQKISLTPKISMSTG